MSGGSKPGFHVCQVSIPLTESNPQPGQILPWVHRGGCEIWGNLASHVLEGQHLRPGHGGHIKAWKLASLWPLPPGPGPASLEPIWEGIQVSESHVFVPALDSNVSSQG